MAWSLWFSTLRSQLYVPKLVDHITFGVPVLILPIPENLDELLQDRSLTAIASLGVLGRIMIMTVHLAFMFIVAVLRPKDGRADGACKMLDVILAIQGRYVRSP